MLHQSLIFTHVLCGALVLLLGLYLMIRPKGTAHHKQVGWAYVTCMWLICASAFLLIAVHRFSFFLMVVGVLTFYWTFVGVRVIRRNRQQKEQWYDWLVSTLTALFGAGLIGYGIYVAFLVQGFHIVSLLSLLFGGGTLNAAWQDLQFYRNREERERQWWLYQHINAMGGSYIAAVTALAVQNGNAFLPDSQFTWLLWIIPGVIGGSILSAVIRGVRRKKLT